MTSTAVLVGIPNVGKSSIFNALTSSKEALVSDIPGTTRDRCYGFIDRDEQSLLLVDTGGLTDHQANIQTQLNIQAWLAIEEADLILLVVDARQPLTDYEIELAQQLRKSEKPVMLIANKTDNDDILARCDTEYYKLGFKHIHPLSAKTRHGVDDLLLDLLPFFSTRPIDLDQTQRPNISIIGRPNAGKSTLFNRLIQKNRSIVSDMPHTTTSATKHELKIKYRDQSTTFDLIDTAGIRRKNKVEQGIESLSIIQSLKMIHDSDLAIFLIDGMQEISQQDIGLIYLCLRRGLTVVIAINKIDDMDDYQKRMIEMNIRERCRVIEHVPIVFISALENKRIQTLLRQVLKAYQSRFIQNNTSYLTRLLSQATQQQSPPIRQGVRPRLQFAHPVAGRKLAIIIQGKRLKELPQSYLRYLEQFYRKKLGLIGTNVALILKQDKNPYQPS